MPKKSRHLGVSWNSAMSKWAAQVRFRDEFHHLGFFADEAVAFSAVIRFKVENKLYKADGTAPTVREAFRYENGALICLYNTPRHSVGDVVGNNNDTDYYLRIKYTQRMYFVHRLIWELHNGRIKTGLEIDHIDGDRSNNRIENLRLVNRDENAKNLKLQARNKTGVPGVIFMNNRYRVTIGSEYLGYCNTLADAIQVRKAAEQRLGYHENHGRRK